MITMQLRIYDLKDNKYYRQEDNYEVLKTILDTKIKIKTMRNDIRLWNIEANLIKRYEIEFEIENYYDLKGNQLFINDFIRWGREDDLSDEIGWVFWNIENQQVSVKTYHSKTKEILDIFPFAEANKRFLIIGNIHENRNLSLGGVE